MTMQIAVYVLPLVLALPFLPTGVPKLLGQRLAHDRAARLGVTEGQARAIWALEVAGGSHFRRDGRTGCYETPRIAFAAAGQPR